MRSNPTYINTSGQLAAEVYRHCRNAGLKCVHKYTDASNPNLKANLVVCDEDWNIIAVAIFGRADKPTAWDAIDIPVIRYYCWEDTYPAAKAIIQLAKGE